MSELKFSKLWELIKNLRAGGFTTTAELIIEHDVSRMDRIEALERELEQRRGWQHCPTHGRITADIHWGCPDCVREQRGEISKLKEELETERNLHTWQYTPAMAEAKIKQLNNRIEELERMNRLEKDVSLSMAREIEAWRNGGVTEEIIRRQDGYVKISKGCVIVLEEQWLEYIGIKKGKP